MAGDGVAGWGRRRRCIPDICYFRYTGKFYTEKCVNQEKLEFATKRKLWFMWTLIVKITHSL